MSNPHPVPPTLLSDASFTACLTNFSNVYEVLDDNSVVNKRYVDDIVVGTSVVRTYGGQIITGQKKFEDLQLFNGNNSVSLFIQNSSTDYDLYFPENSGDYNQVLTTNGASVLSWTDKIGPVFFGISSIVQPITTTNQLLNININKIIDSNYTNLNGLITVDTEGLYEINYQVQFESVVNYSGSLEGTCTAEILINNVLMVGSSSSCYVKKFNGPFLSFFCSKIVLIDLDNQDTIKVVFRMSRGNFNLNTKINESSLLVKMIR